MGTRFAWPDVVALALIGGLAWTPWSLVALFAWVAICGAWRELWDATAGRADLERAAQIAAVRARLAELESSHD